jgi:hypothetical protein
LPFRVVYPGADGTLSAADRQHTAWLYRGIEAAAANADACRIVRLNQRCNEKARAEYFEIEITSSTTALEYQILQVDVLFAVVT